MGEGQKGGEGTTVWETKVHWEGGSKVARDESMHLLVLLHTGSTAQTRLFDSWVLHLQVASGLTQCLRPKRDR